MLERRAPVHLLGRHVAAVHRASRVRELVADPSGILEQLGLCGGEPGERIVRALSRHPRRLLDIRRLAERTFDQAGAALLLIVGVRSEPGFERLSAIPALKVEDDHRVTASGMGRRWLSAGMRERTSEMRLRSMSAKPTPGFSPMSSNTSPQGSTTSEWPKVWRPSSCRPTCA